MKIDKDKLQEAMNEATSGQKKSAALNTFLSSDFEIPEDNLQYSTLDFSKINGLVGEAGKEFAKIADCILAVVNQLNSLERDIASMEIGFGGEDGPHLHIGDNVTLGEGVQYWATGRGEGDHGTVGSERDAGNDFHIDRVAFYIDGKLVANMDETGADVDEYRAKFAEEYGVELSDVEMSFCVGKDDGLAAGWVQEGKDVSYDQLNAQNKEKFKTQSEQLQKDAVKNLEESIANIQKEYDNEEVSTIKNNIKKLDMKKFDDYVPEDISFAATLGESTINVGVGVLKVPVTAVTGTVDIVTNVATLGNGTSLTKYEWESMEELADFGRESMREKGGVNMDDYKTVQEVAGALVWVAPFAEATGAGEVVLFGSKGAPVAGEYVSIGGELYAAGSPEAIAAAEAAAAEGSAAAATTASTTASATMEGLTVEQEATLAVHEAEAAFSNMGVSAGSSAATSTATSTATTVTMEGLSVESEATLAAHEAEAAFSSAFGIETGASTATNTATTVTMEGLTVEQEATLAVQEAEAAFSSGFGVETGATVVPIG